MSACQVNIWIRIQSEVKALLLTFKTAVPSLICQLLVLVYVGSPKPIVLLELLLLTLVTLLVQVLRYWTAALNFHAGSAETAITLPRTLCTFYYSHLHIYSSPTMPFSYWWRFHCQPKLLLSLSLPIALLTSLTSGTQTSPIR